MPVNAAFLPIITSLALAITAGGAAEYRGAGAPVDMVVGQSRLGAAGDFSFSGTWGHMLMSPSDGTSVQLMALACSGQIAEGGLSGTCKMTDRDGDAIRSRWRCELTAPPGQIGMACEGRAVVYDGSGKFGGARGDNSMLLFLRAPQPSSGIGYVIWPAFCLTLADDPQGSQLAAGPH